jgi:hypothetical protein
MVVKECRSSGGAALGSVCRGIRGVIADQWDFFLFFRRPMEKARCPEQGRRVGVTKSLRISLKSTLKERDLRTGVERSVRRETVERKTDTLGHRMGRVSLRSPISCLRPSPYACDSTDSSSSTSSGFESFPTAIVNIQTIPPITINV